MLESERIARELEKEYGAKRLTAWINSCVRDDAMWRFYKSGAFKRLRKAILVEQHNECQKCRAKGKITNAVTVHHVKHVRTHPELALSTTYTDAEGREQQQLIAICKPCHALEHPEKFQRNNQCSGNNNQCSGNNNQCSGILTEEFW